MQLFSVQYVCEVQASHQAKNTVTSVFYTVFNCDLTL